jgi:hypothetical protein
MNCHDLRWHLYLFETLSNNDVTTIRIPCSCLFLFDDVYERRNVDESENQRHGIHITENRILM